jgi:hypothetical protein
MRSFCAGSDEVDRADDEIWDEVAASNTMCSQRNQDLAYFTFGEQHKDPKVPNRQGPPRRDNPASGAAGPLPR